jgi:hypothetical protein
MHDPSESGFSQEVGGAQGGDSDGAFLPGKPAQGWHVGMVVVVVTHKDCVDAQEVFELHTRCSSASGAQPRPRSGPETPNRIREEVKARGLDQDRGVSHTRGQQSGINARRRGRLISETRMESGQSACRRWICHFRAREKDGSARGWLQKILPSQWSDTAKRSGCARREECAEWKESFHGLGQGTTRPAPKLNRDSPGLIAHNFRLPSDTIGGSGDRRETPGGAKSGDQGPNLDIWERFDKFFEPIGATAHCSHHGIAKRVLVWLSICGSEMGAAVRTQSA